MIGGVHHVSDLLSTCHAQSVLLEHTERDGAIAADENLAVIGCGLPHDTLGFVEPWPDAEPKLFQPFLPHIDTQLLFEREGKARRAMIKHYALNPKLVFFEDRTVLNQDGRQLLPTEGFPCAERAHAFYSVFNEFGSRDEEIERMLQI